LFTGIGVDVELGLQDGIVRGLKDALLVGVVIVDVDGLDLGVSF
jgi:hypothetical protein